ncbi:MAG: hypothetical protein KF689_02830 [Gemmatimonadaceae bacterium]|nr:hypothetical protein [Gemmatimonadaceae bacterium]MCW5827666.1 hypothetical protein [Gemmatimonadaceae bacterium]
MLRSDSFPSAVRDLALEAANDLGGVLVLLRPLPRRITVRLERCGESAEAVWLEQTAEILLCDEMLGYAVQFSDAPRSIARFILAHELGHAVADELGEVASGSGEADADQFAAVFLLATGRFGPDVRAAAQLMRQLGEHPELLDATRAERLERAAALDCLVAGWQDSTATACAQVYALARDRWSRRVLQPERRRKPATDAPQAISVHTSAYVPLHTLPRPHRPALDARHRARTLADPPERARH